MVGREGSIGEGYDVVKLVIRARGGMTISHMARVALRLAVEHMWNVEFTFNDATLRISPDAIIRRILERYDALKGPSIEPGSHT
jgi:hypothetical protein